MRDYEVVYIFQSTLTPEDIEGKLESYHAHLTSGGGQVTAVEHWGRRQLAYPIRKETTGYYVVAQFTAAPEVLPELERELKLDEHLLRHLIVLSEGELPLAPSQRHEADESERERDRARGGEPEVAEVEPEVAEADVAEVEAEVAEAGVAEVAAEVAEVGAGGEEEKEEG